MMDVTPATISSIETSAIPIPKRYEFALYGVMFCRLADKIKR